ncbi:MAG: transposase [Phycisphaerae bacterium]|nr:transposase [Phycisphaerae bacterium]
MHRRYDNEFRRQAIKLSTTLGREPTVVARDLGRPVSKLFKWLRDNGWKKSDRAGESVVLPTDVGTAADMCPRFYEISRAYSGIDFCNFHHCVRVVYVRSEKSEVSLIRLITPKRFC